MEEANESTMTRREMIAGTTAAVAALTLSGVTGVQAATNTPPHAVPLSKTKVSFMVNGKSQALEMDTRTTLLDALREHLNVTGTKIVYSAYAVE